VIRDEFREQPSDTDVATGDVATLHCKPPRGEPEPRVRWKKDGEPVAETLDERVLVLEDGRLQLRDTRPEDSGTYACVASNIGGLRESKPSKLAVVGT